ncbi:hypothetical protein EBS02_05070, partial [bacterium]|nr:hypothetical protein [bacterium]
MGFYNYQVNTDAPVDARVDATAQPGSSSTTVINQTADPNVLSTNLHITVDFPNQSGATGLKNLVVKLPTISTAGSPENENYLYDFQWTLGQGASADWVLNVDTLTYTPSVNTIISGSQVLTFDIPVQFNKYAFYGVNFAQTFSLALPASVIDAQGNANQNVTLMLGNQAISVLRGEKLTSSSVLAATSNLDQAIYALQDPDGYLSIIQVYGDPISVSWITSGGQINITSSDSQWLPQLLTLDHSELYFLQPNSAYVENVNVVDQDGLLVSYQSTNLNTVLPTNTGLGLDGYIGGTTPSTSSTVANPLKDVPIDITYDKVFHYGFGLPSDQVVA